MTARIGTTQQVDTALVVLLRLSQESQDGRLRDAIATIRTALHDVQEGRS